VLVGEGVRGVSRAKALGDVLIVGVNSDAGIRRLKGTTGYAIAAGADMVWLGQVHMSDSLGLLYEEVTDYLGFFRSSDE
jgi:bifunctional ADP-heptose synthase (sugar kinase/adenylyltransferase)